MISSEIEIKPERAEAPLIAHILHRFDVGGLENGVVNLINHLPKDKYRHVIIAMEGFNPTFCERLTYPIPVYSVDKMAGKDFGVYFRLYKLIKHLSPYIVHTRNLSAIEAQLPAMLAGVKYRIHGEHGWDVFDPVGEVKKYQIIRRIFGLFITRFVPLSSELESYLVERVRINPRKIMRICNGVDLARFNMNSIAKPSDWPFGEESFVFGCVGRVEKIKGHIDLLSAFALFIAQHPGCNARLCIVGDGSQLSELKAYAKKNGIQDWVWFAGNRSNVPSFMNGFSCFVLPSFAEGISNTILEAMAASLPVIATRVGGNADLIAHEVSGLLVPAKAPKELCKAMTTLYTDRLLMKKMSQAAKFRATTEFSLEKMVGNYEKLYSQMHG